MRRSFHQLQGKQLGVGRDEAFVGVDRPFVLAIGKVIQQDLNCLFVLTNSDQTTHLPQKCPRLCAGLAGLRSQLPISLSCR